MVEEIDRTEVLLEIGDAGDAGEADRTKVLSEDQHPGGAGETCGINVLSEIEDDGFETDRMDVLSEVQEPGAIGEADGRDLLTAVAKAGETERMDVLSEVVEAGGETGRMDALWLRSALRGANEVSRVLKLIGSTWRLWTTLLWTCETCPVTLLVAPAGSRRWASGCEVHRHDPQHLGPRYRVHGQATLMPWNQFGVQFSAVGWPVAVGGWAPMNSDLAKSKCGIVTMYEAWGATMTLMSSGAPWFSWTR